MIRTAMILAAGLGTRLGSITQKTPKCLVPVAGKAVLDMSVERLKSLGVERVIINLHHFAEQVREHVSQQGHYDLEIIFSQEEELLDTGGGVKKVQGILSEQEHFIVHNADIFVSESLEPLLQCHLQGSAVATLLTRSSEDARRLLFDDSGHLLGWENRSTGQQRLVREDVRVSRCLGFCGISCYSREIFEFFPEEEKFSLVTAWLNAAKASSPVQAFTNDSGEWFDIGTLESLELARDKLGTAE